MSEAKSSFRKHVLALLGEGYGDKTLVLCPTVFVRLLRRPQSRHPAQPNPLLVRPHQGRRWLVLQVLR